MGVSTEARPRIKGKQALGRNYGLPLHSSFFAGVDFGHRLRFAKEIAFDVVKEKVLSVRICQIKAVMVNDLGLLLEPVAPARLTDLVENSLAQFVGKRRERKRGSLLATMFALDWFRHGLRTP